MNHPYVAQWVLYRLTEQDAREINQRRADFAAFTASHRGTIRASGSFPGRSGHVGHLGAVVMTGDVFPALVTRVDRETGMPSLEVHPDGNDALHLPAVPPAAGEHLPGTWRPVASAGSGPVVRAGGDAMVSGGDMNIGPRW